MSSAKHKLFTLVQSLVGSLALIVCALSLSGTATAASEEEHPVERDYVTATPSPERQTAEDAAAKSTGCVSCHTASDQATMHTNPAVKLGCTDCHGGNAKVISAQGSDARSKAYIAARDKAHVLPRFPESWKFPSSANPERTYSLLNRESPEFIRFINPGDYRIARESCGACHLKTIQAAERSLMATTSMFWGGAAYNNGLLPFKQYVLGEAYTREGEAAILEGPPATDEDREKHGLIDKMYPLPRWENLSPADVFRVFERGGRNIVNVFPETGLPNSLGAIQRLEEPGRPDLKASNRGPGTGGRIAVPVLNIHKTRLNDPLMWFLGTNDQAGDYRSSGCSSCHVVYANDKDPRHSGPYAMFGHSGMTETADPTIPKDQPGHPIRHEFTRSIPTSQCMICHMHQPNMFVNSFLGYTMWDYESDAPRMWPREQRFPNAEEMRKVLDRNPEAAATRGLWGDPEFLAKVSDLNPTMKDTQFADYHGHGWNFRAVYKRDRKGNLLDAQGRRVSNTDPKKFTKAVHLSSIHVDVGMQCVDCHFAQDNHGDGYMHGEVAQAVEIDCKDCHGSVKDYPKLRTSGPAAGPYGADLSVLRNPDGKLRFEWIGGKLIQRSAVTPGMEWTMSLVKDSVTPGNPHYNAKAARAKLMGRDVNSQKWGPDLPASQLAHSDDNMECYTCHTSWTTSCGGCHLPIEANWKTDRHRYEGGETRNFATYNPQVARDDIFMLGRRGPTEGNKIAPVRSSSALVLSSTNSSRERIYVQQPPIAASGFSSQAMNPHYPHTERKTETKTCSDCHLAKNGDNNAIVAQTMGYGTQFINFIGFNAYVGGQGSVAGVQVTEWEEPQAVIGSYLHRYAYPKWYDDHEKRKKQLTEASVKNTGVAQCLQLRGEYLYVAEGSKGMRVYDVASIGNKGISQKIISAPFSPFGQDTHIPSKNATCVVLPTTQPIHPDRNQGDLMRVKNLEQPFQPIYNYALITDAEEGLILTDINTLADGEFRNNFFKRAVTWNPGGVLKDARHIALGGNYAYIATPSQLVVVDLSEPLKPVVAATLPMNELRSVSLQFRYLFAVEKSGMRVIDVTNPAKPRLVPGASVPLQDGRKLFVARTFAYVAAGKAGLAIIDVEKPEKPKLYEMFDAEGAISDAQDVVVATTNASLYAYVADGQNGLKVIQLTSPESQPRFYGFSPDPKPELIAWYRTPDAALSLSRPLERDRAVDETGGQVAVFGRRGARPFTASEMHSLYLNEKGDPWFVEDDVMLPRAAREWRLGAAYATIALLASVGAPASGDSKHLGVATCASSLCHGSARPLETRAVFQNEYVTWSHFDPHGRAYRVLFEDTAVRMARRLGLKNAHEARECLACHSDSVPRENRGERFQVSDGIGCEACHGASESWLATHSETGTATHSGNLARGLRALERPAVRAETCIRCHVGDGDRFATHQMMAAGHPRLSFELDTYTELWRTSGGREHYRRDADYLARTGAHQGVNQGVYEGARKNPADQPFEPVRIWLTGLAATTRREADLVEQRMALAAGGFPDFALFNCYSCHRSMRVAAWENPADEMTPPGTLRLHDGHARALLAMLDATDDAAMAAPLRSALNALQSANGNPETIRAANRELRAALATIEKRTANRPFKRVDLEASLDALIDAAKRGTFTDYAAAEQAAMGMVLLMAELNIDHVSNDAHAHDVDEMFRTLQDDAQFDGERFARALSLLKR